MQFKLLLTCIITIFLQVNPAIAQNEVQTLPASKANSSMVETLNALKDKFQKRYQPHLSSINPSDKELEDPLLWRSCSVELWKQKKYKLANELYADSKNVIKYSGKDETVFFTTQKEEGGQWFNLQIDTIKELRKKGLTDQEITNKLGQGSDSYISYLNHVIGPKEKQHQTIIFLVFSIIGLIAIIVLLKCLPKKT